ncbi:MAG: hypothetical protein EOO38_09530 [Cytophagaceae bacterium]|nr:MAG: hypothetical protein EOO38_09530 [Cytophagaceae bacterium]
MIERRGMVKIERKQLDILLDKAHQEGFQQGRKDFEMEAPDHIRSFDAGDIWLEETRLLDGQMRLTATWRFMGERHNCSLVLTEADYDTDIREKVMLDMARERIAKNLIGMLKAKMFRPKLRIAK